MSTSLMTFRVNFIESGAVKNRLLYNKTLIQRHWGLISAAIHGDLLRLIDSWVMIYLVWVAALPC